MKFLLEKAHEKEPPHCFDAQLGVVEVNSLDDLLRYLDNELPENERWRGDAIIIGRCSERIKQEFGVDYYIEIYNGYIE